MAQQLYGSINYDKLLEALKQGKLKTYKAENGTRYINIDIFVKDETDQYGNRASISCPLKDEFKSDNEKRIYIGNLKESEAYQPQEATFNNNEDDLPF